MDATQTISHYEHNDVRHSDTANRRDDAAVTALDEQLDLLPSRGILFSIALGAGLWALIFAIAWVIFH